jgi:hypothetical protein
VFRYVDGHRNTSGTNQNFQHDFDSDSGVK